MVTMLFSAWQLGRTKLKRRRRSLCRALHHTRRSESLSALASRSRQTRAVRKYNWAFTRALVTPGILNLLIKRGKLSDGFDHSPGRDRIRVEQS